MERNLVLFDSQAGRGSFSPTTLAGSSEGHLCGTPCGSSRAPAATPAAYGTQPGAHAVVRLATADGPESTGPSSQATCAGQVHGAMASQHSRAATTGRRQCSPSTASR